MTKIVYNACYGGFSLSDKAMRRYAELKGLPLYPERAPQHLSDTYWTVPPEERTGKVLSDDDFYKASERKRRASNEFYRAHTLGTREFDRTDPILVQVVEELGAAASGQFAKLTIADLPEGTRYRIDEYDGFESIETAEAVDWSVA